MSKQTEKQFKIMYGEQAKWSKGTSAMFDVLFRGAHRPVAAREHGCKTPTIHAAMGRNTVKHVEAIEEHKKLTAYLKAGEK